MRVHKDQQVVAESSNTDSFTMRIFHFGTIDSRAGGPAMSTTQTLNGLTELGVKVELMTFPLEKGHEAVNTNFLCTELPKVPFFPRFAYYHGLSKEIDSLGHFDVYHAQGVWQYSTYCVALTARRHRKPYVITPRGMLYPQDIHKSNYLFKYLSLKLRLLDDLNKAACVHVTCEDELRHCRELGVVSPIAVIPNPIPAREFDLPNFKTKRRIVYLGRLSPRKNVESLIYAFGNSSVWPVDAELYIVGGGDEAYERFLKSETQRLGLTNVVFTGFLTGERKDEILQQSHVLVMPSEFENFGNVILEGLIRGIPCITTKGSPWEDLIKSDCGWWVDYDQEAISAAVEEAVFCPNQRLFDMGLRAQKLIAEKYTTERVALKMRELYQWLITKGQTPDFVEC